MQMISPTRLASFNDMQDSNFFTQFLISVVENLYNQTIKNMCLYNMLFMKGILKWIR